MTEHNWLDHGRAADSVAYSLALSGVTKLGGDLLRHHARRAIDAWEWVLGGSLFEDEIEGLKRQLSAAKCAIASLQERLSSRPATLDGCYRKIEDLEKQVAHLRESRNCAEKKAEYWAERAGRAEAERDQCLASEGEAVRRAEDAEARADRLCEDLWHANQRALDLSARLNLHKGTADKLRKERRTRRVVNHDHKKEADRLRAELAEADAALDRCGKMNGVYRERLDNIRKCLDGGAPVIKHEQDSKHKPDLWYHLAKREDEP